MIKTAQSPSQSFRIELLADHPEAIPQLTKIWLDVLGSIWLPSISLERVEKTLHGQLNTRAMPLTYVAFQDGQAVGMASLTAHDGIRPDLTPWLASLVIDPFYQSRGIGPKLIQAIKEKAMEFGFKELYLFALDETIPEYYGRLGWKRIGDDTFHDNHVIVMKTDL